MRDFEPILQQMDKAWQSGLEERSGGFDSTISRKFTALVGNGNTSWYISKKKQERLIQEAVTFKFLQLDNLGRSLRKHKTARATVMSFPQSFSRIRSDVLKLLSRSGMVFDFTNLFLNQIYVEMTFMGIKDTDEYCDLIHYLLLSDYDDLEGYAKAILKFKGVKVDG